MVGWPDGCSSRTRAYGYGFLYPHTPNGSDTPRDFGAEMLHTKSWDKYHSFPDTAKSLLEYHDFLLRPAPRAYWMDLAGVFPRTTSVPCCMCSGGTLMCMVL